MHPISFKSLHKTLITIPYNLSLQDGSLLFIVQYRHLRYKYLISQFIHSCLHFAWSVCVEDAMEGTLLQSFLFDFSVPCHIRLFLWDHCNLLEAAKPFSVNTWSISLICSHIPSINA